MEKHHIEYMKLNFPNEPHRAMTSYDTKAANIIQKIKSKYANYIESRRHTVLLEKGPLIEIKHNNQGAAAPKAAAEPKTTAPKAAAVADVAICKAIVMRTNAQCGRKLKPGCEFCGFHKK